MDKEPADRNTLKEHRERLQGHNEMEREQSNENQWTNTSGRHRGSLSAAPFDSINPQTNSHRNPNQSNSGITHCLYQRPRGLSLPINRCDLRSLIRNERVANATATRRRLANLPVSVSAFIFIMVCITSCAAC